MAGFSVIGGYQIVSAAKLSRLTRRLSPGTRIVWGGISPTNLPELTVAEDFVDYVALGEGEETLAELFEALRRPGGDASGVRGLVYRENGSICRTPQRPVPDVEALPFVYQGKAAAMLGRYLEQRSVREAVGYEVSRGCPFLCTFCYSPDFHNETRAKSPEKVASELAELKRLGALELDIYDDTLFGARRELFPAYLELLRASGHAWIGKLRINMLDKELLSLLETSGCKWLYFGIESDDDQVLKAVKKGFNAREVREGLDLMRGSRLHSVFSFIYGLPLAEEQDKLGQSRYRGTAASEHPNAEIQIQSYVPLPGSEPYGEALRRGFKPFERILEWADHDHFKVSNPLLEDPALANKVYISSFLAFRYRRHFSHFPLNVLVYPLHRLSLWRLRRRFFRWHLETVVYDGILALSRLTVGVYFMARDGLFYLRLPSRAGGDLRSVGRESVAR